ncbi:Metacaspase-1A [Escovopsis weberi]|uniref:Metacaspase-1A n=1 Tax=Escovopsis weberi TaxID=150374 RepID=A0A0M8MY70_ESCWE|nr:Metacaspase-1A [Escovopsis weberi]
MAVAITVATAAAVEEDMDMATAEEEEDMAETTAAAATTALLLNLNTLSITGATAGLLLLIKATALLPRIRDTAINKEATEALLRYSNCTGKRKALLIGVNYLGTKNELKGCINDVHNVSSFLSERYGYKREDMVILTDDQQNPVSHPTRANILRAFGWLVNGAEPNDSLFLHYSGHGGQVEDEDGDEDDGYDECIYPVDHETAGPIIDDEIHFRVVKPLKQGVRLTAIFDSCHSATVMDLPYVYSTKGVLKEPNLAKEAGQGLLGAFTAYASGDMAGVASSVFGFAKTAFMGDGAYNKTKDTRTSAADVVMWSGSKDDQTSADATINAQATGAMSWAFISAITKNPKQSYVELLNSVREILETKYTQKPQLSCSHPLDTDLLFVM